MKEYGYVRVAALSPQIRVADLDYNKTSIVEAIRQAASGAPRLIQDLLIFLAQNW